MRMLWKKRLYADSLPEMQSESPVVEMRKFIRSKQIACAFVDKGRKENHPPNGMKNLL